MNEHLRQTGRTERMLARAVSLAAQRRAVYIFTDSKSVRRLQNDPMIQAYPSIKVEEMPRHFAWEHMCPAPGQHHPNCVFLVEHHIIEQEVDRIDKQILRLQQLNRQLYALTT